MHSLRSVTVSLLLASATSIATHADWAQWRGPTRDAKSPETGLLKEWPAGGPPLVWEAKGLGFGYSSISSSGGRLFTMGDKDDAGFAIAIDPGSGKILWKTKVGKAGAPGWGGFKGPRSTPSIDSSLVFALGQYGELVCLDARAGQEKWRKDFTQDFGGKIPEWGFAESPLVDGDNLICTPGGAGGTVAALDKKTGALLWRSKDLTDNAHYSSPVKATIAGVKQYVILTAQNVAGISVQDGKVLWKAPRKGQTAVIPTPVCKDNLVYVTSGYGVGCNLFKISATGGQFSAEQIYANDTMVNHHGGVILVGDHLYGHSDKGGWVCQELKTGQAAWKSGKLGKGSVVFADGHLYLRQEDKAGTIALIEATPEGFKETGRFDQPDRIGKNTWAHPVVTGGRLFLRDDDILLCYDLIKK